MWNLKHPQRLTTVFVTRQGYFRMYMKKSEKPEKLWKTGNEGRTVSNSCVFVLIMATGIKTNWFMYSGKSLQLCPTLCDLIDGSPPGSPVPGILQARTQEWVAISFSNAWKWKVKVKSLSRVRLRDSMDCSLPGSSIHGIFQARGLEWGAIAFSIIQTNLLHFILYFQDYSLLLLNHVLMYISKCTITYHLFQKGWRDILV